MSESKPILDPFCLVDDQRFNPGPQWLQHFGNTFVNIYAHTPHNQLDEPFFNNNQYFKTLQKLDRSAAWWEKAINLPKGYVLPGYQKEGIYDPNSKERPPQWVCDAIAANETLSNIVIEGYRYTYAKLLKILTQYAMLDYDRDEDKWMQKHESMELLIESLANEMDQRAYSINRFFGNFAIQILIKDSLK
ncbi:lyase-like protein [Ranid herpesvirus 3]|uniref:Lyase-like protein n=1 Tax=Ranid herpesvirus 3 TaxID=1987509 RepID=A0A1X9T5K4_9VIRU|nr:lyase-like protein [Ranid herpesvirus 3]ARR28984.1 lyase-like protein [Ranid herpesvirus 3]